MSYLDPLVSSKERANEHLVDGFAAKYMDRISELPGAPGRSRKGLRKIR